MFLIGEMDRPILYAFIVLSRRFSFMTGTKKYALPAREKDDLLSSTSQPFPNTGGRIVSNAAHR